MQVGYIDKTRQDKTERGGRSTPKREKGFEWREGKGLRNEQSQTKKRNCCDYAWHKLPYLTTLFGAGSFLVLLPNKRAREPTPPFFLGAIAANLSKWAVLYRYLLITTFSKVDFHFQAQERKREGRKQGRMRNTAWNSNEGQKRCDVLYVRAFRCVKILTGCCLNY